MQQRNGGSGTKKRTSVFASKIRAILSQAYRMAFGFGVAADEEREKKDTHGCLTMSCRRRPTASLLTCTTGLRRWKSTLKKVAKVKLKINAMGINQGKKKEEANAAASASELELCKKRILMGEKCRALNLSGVLHYDSRGILLPED